MNYHRRRYVFALAASATYLVVCVLGDGTTGCPCLATVGSALDLYKENGNLMYAGSIYPSDYGVGCKVHDENLPPYCTSSNDNDPEWCTESFCYIDKDNCDLPLKYLSGYFPESGLYYSFQTCGNEGTFFDWFSDGDDDSYELVDLADLIETYVSTIRDIIEADYVETAAVTSACPYAVSCGCESCETNADWGEDVSFTTGTLVPKESVLDSTTCMASTLNSYFLRIAGAEYQDSSNIGFMLAGFQGDGALIQWPAIEWCPTDYDPRFRPWYAAAVTNPKVLILVIDISGSMSVNGRIELARDAAKAVLRTLGWKDKVGFVLFNSVVVHSRDPDYVTDDNRITMDSWIDARVFAAGGTAFYEPLMEALDMIDADNDVDCSNVILFLTDGVASFTESNYNTVYAQASSSDVVMFTYALGSGAETTITKRIACENDGIFYKVSDGADLAAAMSSYYAYYAAATQNDGIRWLNYDEIATGTELISACAPVYDPLDESGVSVVLGAICMDMTILSSLDTMRANSGWDALFARIESDSEKCLPSWRGLGPGGKTQALEAVRTAEAVNGAKTCGAAYVQDDDFYTDPDDDNTIKVNSTSGGSGGGSGGGLKTTSIIIIAVVLVVAAGILWLIIYLVQEKCGKKENADGTLATMFQARQSTGSAPLPVAPPPGNPHYQQSRLEMTAIGDNNNNNYKTGYGGEGAPVPPGGFGSAGYYNSVPTGPPPPQSYVGQGSHVPQQQLQQQQYVPVSAADVRVTSI